MQVVQQELEVMLSVSVGDDDGGTMPGLTVRWPVMSPTHHQWIFPLNCFESEPWWKVYMDRPICEHKVVCCHYQQETRLEPRQIIWLEHDSLWFEGDSQCVPSKTTVYKRFQPVWILPPTENTWIQIKLKVVWKSQLTISGPTTKSSKEPKHSMSKFHWGFHDSLVIVLINQHS